MPAAFLNCVKRGGKVRTKDLGKGRYIRICFLNGKSYAGEVKKVQGHHSAADGSFLGSRRAKFGVD